MINSNELRKGNLFHPVSTAGGIELPATGVAFKVVELLVFKCRAVIHDQNPAQVEEWTEFEYSEMYPVPLTPRYLQAIGAEKISNGEFYKIKGLLFKNYDMNLTLGSSHYILDDFEEIATAECKYLHQLQNIVFDLTGEELNIKL